MGAPEPVHRGQQLANERHAQATDQSNPSCDYCGGRLDPLTSEEVTHTIPTADGRDALTRRYCSPSCFIRETQEVSAIGSRDGA